ncbi:MAG: response regulator [Magnetococcales bacterium]|nr:response regulator [Magnetococcales bacterium]
MELTDDARRQIEEMLRHAERLLDASSNSVLRQHLLAVRQAADALLSHLDTAETIQTGMTETLSIPSMPPAILQGHPHILLVEDNPFTQKLMTRLLTQQGYRVTLAQNGHEALEEMSRAVMDLVLMDLRMPVMDGFQATSEIRERENRHTGRRVPIIAVTALVAEEEQQRALEVGVDGYHPKPVRAAILFAEMERLLSAQTTPAHATTTTADVEDVEMIVDMDRLLKTVDGDMELLKEITELYFTDAPRQMSRIENALALGNANEVREAAHSLKGATGAFGRIRVYDLALALEQAGKKGELRQAEDLWLQLTSALRIMKETIQKEIVHLSGESS